LSQNGTLTLKSDTLTHNATTGDDGGAVETWGNITVSGGTVSDNSAPMLSDGVGGGIDAEGCGYSNSPPTVTISDVTLSGNSASEGGGLNLFCVQSATIGKGTLLTNNSAENGGGAILVADFKATITDATFMGNSVVGASPNDPGSGNLDVARANGDDLGSTVTMSKCTLEGVIGGTGTGALGIFNKGVPGTTLSVTDLTLT